MTDPEHNCFWQGGLISFASVFVLGVMLTLLVIGTAVHISNGAERDVGKAIGHCEEACLSKEMSTIGLTKDGCLCLSPFFELVRTSTHSAIE